jgi:hypothetical protein
MKQRSFQATIGGRGGTGDLLFLSGFNVERIVATCYKMDAGTVGQLYAINDILNYFQPLALAKHDDVPKLYFGFFPPDTGASAHESITGAALTITGGAQGVVMPHTFGPQRYRSSWGFLHGASAGALGSGNNWLNFSEANNQPWTWMGWVYYVGSANAEMYAETNVAATVNLVFSLFTTGAIVAQHTGGGTASLASGAGIIPINSWFHLGITWNAGTLTVFVNAVSVFSGAWVRATVIGNDALRLNGFGNGNCFLSGVEIYNNMAMNADDLQRHIDYVNVELAVGGFVAGTANLGRHGTGTVIFSNDIVPGFDSASYTVRMPLTAINLIQSLAGVYLASIDTWERETL